MKETMLNCSESLKISNQWCTNEICEKSCTIEICGNCQLKTIEKILIVVTEFCYLSLLKLLKSRLKTQ